MTESGDGVQAVTDRISLTLWNAQQGHQELRRAWDWCKAMLMAGHKLQIDCKPETRSSAENRMLHALISEIATARRNGPGRSVTPNAGSGCLSVRGAERAASRWKSCPALDGHGVDIVPARTSKLTKARMRGPDRLRAGLGR
jgi:hypothetical protein